MKQALRHRISPSFISRSAFVRIHVSHRQSAGSGASLHILALLVLGSLVLTMAVRRFRKNLA